MAKFIYRMESLLNIKLKIEEQEKAAYSLAQAKLYEEERILSGFKQQRIEYLERKREGMSGVLNVKDLELTENAIHTMDLKIKEQVFNVKRATKEVETARARLDNAMKERKIQEKLKENAFEEFKKEVNAEEQQEINELVSFRFGNGKDKREE